MQDRNDGFKCHHRIAAAKELIVHIVRDEQPESVPSKKPPPFTLSLSKGREAAEARSASVRAEPGQIVVPAEAGTHPAHHEANSTPTPRSLSPRRACPVLDTGRETHPRTVAMGEPVPEHPGADTQPPNPEPDEGSQLETNNSKLETPSARQPRRRRTSPRPPSSVRGGDGGAISSFGVPVATGMGGSREEPVLSLSKGLPPSSRGRESTPSPHIYGGITVTSY